MSEDTANREPDATTVGEPIVSEPEAAPSDATPSPVAAPAKTRRGLPRWLPLFLLAVVPAVVVGLLVYVIAGGSGEKDRSAAVIDGFVHSNGPNDSAVTSYKGALPPGFPKDLPLYSGAKTVSSFLVASEDGRNYFAVLSTSAPPTKVYDYYLSVMDKEPWQVEVATSGGEFTGLRFTNPGNPDVQGEVAIYKSSLDDLTNIFITYQDESTQARRAEKPESKFTLGPSAALPPGFPSEVPMYTKSGEPVVIETYFERSPGVTEYSISYLTKGSQGDVIKHYDDEFKKKSWETREPRQSSGDFALALAFSDRKQIEGTVSVDTFEKDDNYQKVELFVAVSKGSGSPAPGTAPRREGN